MTASYVVTQTNYRMKSIMAKSDLYQPVMEMNNKDYNTDTSMSCIE
jgi:hypothetical protein